MGQIEKNIAGLEPPAVEGLTRAPFPRCSNPEREWMTRPCLFAIWIQTWRGETEGTFAHRGGQYENEYVEVFGSAPVFEK